MRSVTIGLPIWSTPPAQLSELLAALLEQARAGLAAHGLTSRTIRLSLPPVPPEISRQPGAVGSALAAVQELATESGARWYCLPIDLVDDEDHGALLGEVLGALVKNPRLFVNLMVADATRIAPRGARAAAELVLNVARRSRDGFDGFRVGVSCACRPNTPFFPFSRHEGDDAAVSIALETTGAAIAALDALPPGASLGARRDALEAALLERVRRADAFGRGLETATGVRYAGLDASYAPYPGGASSVGALVERLGVSPVGTNGTLFVTSVLTDTLQSALDRAGARRAGFNGVMYSVLEDTRLAAANNLASLSIDKLLLFSALCGCGIDMVPIPATAFVEDVAAIVLDVAALAVRLGKPLGVRLVPVPDKRINEIVSFNLDFLCDSRVMNPGVSDSTLARAHEPLWSYQHPPPRAALSPEPPGKAQPACALDRAKIRAFWDARAKLYEHLAFESIANLEQDGDALQLKITHETDKVFEWLGSVEGKTILDLGAGVGQWAFRFAERRAAHVTAVEYSPELVAIGRTEAARRRLDTVELVVSAAEAFSTEEQFDLVFCSGLCVYLDDEQLATLARRLPGWVRPGGLLLVRDGMGRERRHEINDRFSEHLQANYSATYRTRATYLDALAETSLELIRDENMFPEGHPLNKYPETRLHLFLFRRTA